MNDSLKTLINDPLYRSYFYYCSILVLKMLMMSALTGIKRMIFRIFINPEDSAVFKAKITTNERVERVRRAHLNDLENIPLFFVAAFIFCLTGPSLAWATLLFKTFTYTRIVHTLVYAVYPVVQPTRMIVWTIGYLIIGYMASSSVLYFM
ncbi:microsomal glutathione S-transferase 1-like [Harmonia axyridis]|uniref:microsomal glutathione S-transferase 1-like n=1 Tax=Harmonia axyridis TaxID=115357 RepID=UPI001E276C5C|nr:microsomal glutathione S-transferase 1-like [Harmonia axyridis]